MILTKKQSQALDILEDKQTTELLFGGGAGGGKSVLGCYWILKNCFKYPGTRWLIGRSKLKSLKETTLNTFWEVCKEQGITSDMYEYNQQEGSITFHATKSQILLKDLFLYPSDPLFDDLGSLEITGAFIDECNQVVLKAWNIVKSRIRFKIDEYGLVPKILGTCNPSKNWVYAYFYRPSKEKTLTNNIKFIQSLLSDNKHISKHYRENLLTLDSNSKQRLLFGNWDYDDDPSVLCTFDAISDIFVNDHIKPTGNKYISADLAMKGRDRFVTGLWDGYVCHIKIDKAKSTGKEIEEDLKNLMISDSVPRSQSISDSDGMGAYLESYLTGIKEFHGNARANDDTEYSNLKSECAYKLAELINKRQIRVICNSEQKQLLSEELGQLKADDLDADEKKKRIIKKELMKEALGRSPDYLDMLIMRMFFEVKPAIKRIMSATS